MPIVIEFAGTADWTTHINWLSSDPPNADFSSDDALLGQAVTGRIIMETDGLSEITTSSPGFSNFIVYNPLSDPLRLVTRELTIGGLDYSVGAYPYQSGSILMRDALWADEMDTISIQHRYTQRPPGPVSDGQWSSAELTVQWSDLNDPHGLVDLSQGFDPLQFVSRLSSLPVYVHYMTGINSCVDGVCRTITQSFTSLDTNSFRIYAASVPEPGTLGLFAAGLLGVGLGRRRRQR